MIFILRRLRRCCISSVIFLAGHILLTHDHMELLFNGIHIESLAFLIYKVPVAFGDPLYFNSPPTPPLNYKKSTKTPLCYRYIPYGTRLNDLIIIRRLRLNCKSSCNLLWAICWRTHMVIKNLYLMWIRKGK